MNLSTRFYYSPSRDRVTWRTEGENVMPPSEPNDWRPLALIDPEDREAVERLVRLAFPMVIDPSIRIDLLAAGLREFANPKPPKPDEPTGQDVERDVLRRAAAELREQAVTRFSQYGPSDIRGAALWDAACHIAPVEAP